MQEYVRHFLITEKQKKWVHTNYIFSLKSGKELPWTMLTTSINNLIKVKQLQKNAVLSLSSLVFFPVSGVLFITFVSPSNF